tara:strand:+ start:182 stop:526 length:345 start_codon:yes stop_codon:yes gene_type:complete
MPEYTKQVQTGTNKAGPIYSDVTFKYKKNNARIQKKGKGKGSSRPGRTRSSLAIASLSGENNLYKSVYGGQQSAGDLMKRQNQADMRRDAENEQQRRYSYYRGTLFRGKQERQA